MATGSWGVRFGWYGCRRGVAVLSICCRRLSEDLCGAPSEQANDLAGTTVSRDSSHFLQSQPIEPGLAHFSLPRPCVSARASFAFRLTDLQSSLLRKSSCPASNILRHSTLRANRIQ
jgi:hypothetical protein